MPGFKRPFPSRKWLKESLARAQAELATSQRANGILGENLRQTERARALLAAQAQAQADTIAQQDEDNAGLRRAYLEMQEHHARELDVAAKDARELDAAIKAAETAHLRADAWEQEVNATLARLADREARLRQYRLDKVAWGLRYASMESRLRATLERNENQAGEIRQWRSQALSETVGAYRYRLILRLVHTLWESRRRYQAEAEQEHAERFDLL